MVLWTLAHSRRAVSAVPALGIFLTCLFLCERRLINWSTGRACKAHRSQCSLPLQGYVGKHDRQDR
jgi:hypothetical protein